MSVDEPGSRAEGLPVQGIFSTLIWAVIGRANTRVWVRNRSVMVALLAESFALDGCGGKDSSTSAASDGMTSGKSGSGQSGASGMSVLGQGGTTGGSSAATTGGAAPVAKMLATSMGKTCVLMSDGSVRCWGGGVTVPVRIESLGDAVAIAGGWHSCAVLVGGTIRCWGSNRYGQLGDGTTTDSDTPVAVTGLTSALTVTVGWEHTCALLSGGTVQCWGAGANRWAGGGGAPSNSLAPVTVAAVTGVTALSTNGEYNCALLSDKTVQCWGLNDEGQLGNGTATNSLVPVTVSGF